MTILPCGSPRNQDTGVKYYIENEVKLKIVVYEDKYCDNRNSPSKLETNRCGSNSVDV